MNVTLVEIVNITNGDVVISYPRHTCSVVIPRKGDRLFLEFVSKYQLIVNYVVYEPIQETVGMGINVPTKASVFVSPME